MLLRPSSHRAVVPSSSCSLLSPFPTARTPLLVPPPASYLPLIPLTWGRGLRWPWPCCRLSNSSVCLFRYRFCLCASLAGSRPSPLVFAVVRLVPTALLFAVPRLGPPFLNTAPTPPPLLSPRGGRPRAAAFVSLTLPMCCGSCLCAAHRVWILAALYPTLAAAEGCLGLFVAELTYELPVPVALSPHLTPRVSSRFSLFPLLGPGEFCLGWALRPRLWLPPFAGLSGLCPLCLPMLALSLPFVDFAAAYTPAFPPWFSSCCFLQVCDTTASFAPALGACAFAPSLGLFIRASAISRCSLWSPTLALVHGALRPFAVSVSGSARWLVGFCSLGAVR